MMMMNEHNEIGMEMGQHGESGSSRFDQSMGLDRTMPADVTTGHQGPEIHTPSRDNIKAGTYFPSDPIRTGGSINAFSGKSTHRTLVLVKSPGRPDNAQVGRVRAMQKRIDELERSAMAMYSQHAGAALALEREVAALREERKHLDASIPKNSTQPNSRRSSGRKVDRPLSAPSFERTWVITSSPIARQSLAAERLAKPVQRSSVPALPPGFDAQKTRSVPSAKAQKEAAERLFRGSAATTNPWEAEGDSFAVTQRVATPTKSTPPMTPIGAAKAAEGRPRTSGGRPRTPMAARDELERPRTTPAAAAGGRALFDQFINTTSSRPPSAAMQKQSIKRLSSPARSREKVTTEGISKTSVEWVEFYAKQTPGPGQYEVSKAEQKLLGPSGGRFSKAKPKTDVEVLEDRARAVPGPGQYNLPGTGAGIGGGVFSTACPLSDVDVKIKDASSKPGPGQYGDLPVDTRGRLLKGRGRTISKSKPLSDVDVRIMEASRKPGPGQYKLPGLGSGVGGGAFSTAKPLSDVEVKMIDAASKPGPGHYGAPRDPRKDVASKGRKFSTAYPLSDVQIKMNDAASKPGPGQYGSPKKPVKEGHTGKFPFVYKPKDPKKAYLAKC